MTRHLKPLVGLHLAAARRAADMRTFQFGALRAVDGGSVGEFALHVQCPWRIDSPGEIVTGHSDLWEPSRPEQIDREAWSYDDGDSLQDERLANLLAGLEQGTKADDSRPVSLVVESADGDDWGGACLHLSGGYRLVLFPAGTRGEDWRVFSHVLDEPHFVVSGGSIEARDGAA